MKCNQSCPVFEFVSLCPFPTTITITPRAPPVVSKFILIFSVTKRCCTYNLFVVYFFLLSYIQLWSTFTHTDNHFELLYVDTKERTFRLSTCRDKIKIRTISYYILAHTSKVTLLSPVTPLNMCHDNFILPKTVCDLILEWWVWDGKVTKFPWTFCFVFYVFWIL